MKKKFSLWLNIATICLCICAIAVGVYSAQKATLNVAGTVGFTAHDCDVYVYGITSGAVDSSGADISPTYGTESAYINIHNDKTGWAMGTMYFNDLGNVPDGKNAVDIVITLKMYNASKFDVKATFNTEFISSSNLTGKVTATPSSAEMILSADKTKADATTMTITLTLATADDITTPIEFSGKVLVSFERYVDQKLYIGEGDDAGKLMMKMGHGTEKDSATNVDLEWYAFGVKGSYDGTTATAPTGIAGLTNDSYHIVVDKDTESTDDDEVWYSLQGVTITLESAKGHTFWFIQKYVVSGGYNEIDGIVFANNAYVTGYGYKNDDFVSDIYTYVTGKYLTETGISNDLYYNNKIDIRAVNELYGDKFEAKLWLISKEELQLISGKEYVWEGNNLNCGGYGVGNNQSVATWWLRTCNDYPYACICKDSGGVLSEISPRESNPGIRPAFQIQIQD